MRSENMHHVTLESQATDFERIEVIGADALLAAAWVLLTDAPARAAMRQSGHQFAQAYRGATARLLRWLEP